MDILNVLDRHYNIDYIQEFYWLDGTLRIHLLGRSVPEIFADPDGSMYRKLCRLARVEPKGKGAEA